MVALSRMTCAGVAWHPPTQRSSLPIASVPTYGFSAVDTSQFNGHDPG